MSRNREQSEWIADVAPPQEEGVRDMDERRKIHARYSVSDQANKIGVEPRILAVLPLRLDTPVP